jgi:hypothetical protein
VDARIAADALGFRDRISISGWSGGRSEDAGCPPRRDQYRLAPELWP